MLPAGRPAPLAGVVIPAHDEADGLGATLDALLAGAGPGELDVVVVANACTDPTADVARARGVRTLVTDVPGKAHALRLGDAACAVFPKVYLDADVRLSTQDVRRMVDALASSGALACAPRPVWDEDGVGRWARRVHRVHEQLVAPRRGLAGAGAYVLSERGHDRVFPLPDVISDDGWVHRHFAPAERLVVSGARSIVRPAPSLAACLRRRTRLRRGNQQLVELGLAAPEGRLGIGGLRPLVLRRRAGVLDVALYLAVVALDRASTRLRGGAAVHWSTAHRR